ncbi:MAG: transglutaminaseTgpA domain-containing protein, partial [Lysobacteraceae bacterium]
MSAPLALALRQGVGAAVRAASLPLLMHLPGRVALGVGAVGLAAGASALTRPLPSWLRVALVLLVSGAVVTGFGFRVGRDAGSALLLAMLVLKLSELRDIDDARRLVAFALFAPFAAFLQDQGPLTLALGLAGALGILAALSRLAREDSPSPT